MAAIGLQCRCGQGVPESVLSSLVADHTASIWCSACGLTSRLESLVPTRVAPVDGDGRCVLCGSRAKKLNPHRMDISKIRVLRAIARLNDEGSLWVKATHADTLVPESGRIYKTSWRAAEHAARLRWFGLLEYNGRRSGQYQINDAGRQFLAGTLSVPAVIRCRNGEVIERSTETVSITDAAEVSLGEDYWDGYADEQRHASDGPAVTKV
jgi:hypothetical protein